MTGAEATRIVRAEVGSTNLDTMLAYIRSRQWDYSVRGGSGGDAPHRARIEVYLMGRTERERELMAERARHGGGGKRTSLHSGESAHGWGPAPYGGGTSARWAVIGALAQAITVYGTREETT